LRLRVGRGKDRHTVVAHGRRLATVIEALWRKAARWAAREERLEKSLRARWRRARGRGGMKRSHHSRSCGADADTPGVKRLEQEAWHLIMPSVGKVIMLRADDPWRLGRGLVALDPAVPFDGEREELCAKEWPSWSPKSGGRVGAAETKGPATTPRSEELTGKGRASRQRRRKRGEESARQRQLEALARLQRCFRRVLAIVHARAEERRGFAACLIQSQFRRLSMNWWEKMREVLRPFPRCRWGTRLATAEDFANQRASADAVLRHQRRYGAIFERLYKRKCVIGDLCAAQGGAFEGIVRYGAEGRALDLKRYEEFVARFGEERLTVGSATSEEDVRRMGVCDGYLSSPPCQATSAMAHCGGGLTESKEEQLIPAVRRLLQQTGKPWVIENPMGAVTQKMMRRDISFTNHDFGLRACRPRAFETSFPVVKEVDGRWLTKCCCLGRKNRMPRRDRFGRRRPCCNGNHEAVYGTPMKGASSKEDWEEAMGVEHGHMSVRGLALAIPPVFAEYLVGQMVAHILKESKWKVPVITYEEALADPAKEALLRRWEQGIGPVRADDKMAEEPAARAPEAGTGGTSTVPPHAAGTLTSAHALDARGRWTRGGR
jgi:hypothetical protein